MSSPGNNSPFPWEGDTEPVAPPASAQSGPSADTEANPATEPVAQPDSGDVLPPHGADVIYEVAPTRDEGGAVRRTERQLVRKEYYAISEVADLVGLPAHVLRYWESQFSVLNPSKNRSGNRVYQRKEIRLILLVKQLLYDEKYTVEGAKQKLEQLRRGGGLGDATTHALDTQLVRVMRDELRSLLEILTPVKE